MDYTDYKFYKFRYTLSEDLGDNYRQIMYLQSLLLPEDGEYVATGGFEKLNKFNEPTHAHIHIHFGCKSRTLGGMRKALQREFKNRGETRKGNALYSLTEESDVIDVNRFLRYCWKQGGRITDSTGLLEKLPKDIDIDLETKLAKEEQERMWEFNRKKQDESMRPNTKDKLFEYLDGLHKKAPFLCKRSILIKIMEYYNQEEKSANKSTIIGYLQTAIWRYKLETFEQTADIWLNSM